MSAFRSSSQSGRTRMKRPPYASTLDVGITEVRVLLGHATAWQRARAEVDHGLHRSIVMEPGVSYDLSVVRGRAVLLIALDESTGADVRAAAIKLLEHGAEHVAAISESGAYRLFKAAQCQ